MIDDVVVEFLVESNENLDSLDRELVQLEKDPSNRSTLASIFRTIHTIKGTCGFLGFTKLESVAHVGENLLSRLRDGVLALTPEIITSLLRMVDAIRQMLKSIESAGSEGERDDSELIGVLNGLQQGGPVSPREKTIPAPAPVQMEKQGTSEPVAEVPQPNPLERGGVSDASIRVNVVLLDKLMNLVGELVLTRNQILQFTNTSEDAGLLATSQRLNIVTSELQEGVMKTRMQPIGNIWSKFPRTVRDVAAACGKQIHIEMEGKETELDKTIIEAIKDPLTHIVRNSADHGIETPAHRVAVGKHAEGRLTLRAFHEGGQVNIEISDDGAGLDSEKIRKKAVEKGLISQEQAGRLNDREAANLIFLSGFSTAEKVTNVSGRGVGMDVVKTNIEKIGGTVDVQSNAGQGMTVRMKIPLTLAIIPTLIVTSGGARYAIPQISLLELVRLESEHAQKEVELIQGVPVYRLRGRLLPLVYLNLELNVPPKGNFTKENSAVNIVVLQADDRQFGLVVDEINDTEEIVVKPLGKQLKGIKTFAGSTIMGDGRVALIVDVLGLALRAGVVSEQRSGPGTSVGARAVLGVKNERQTFLLFSGPDDARMALFLDSLARLEEIRAAQIERSGSQLVVQYRGEILPLIRLEEFLPERRAKRRNPLPADSGGADGNLQVLVCNRNGNSAGIVVERILDIVEDRAITKSPATRPGILYAAVINERVTEVVDLPAILSGASLFEHEKVEVHL